MQNLLTKKSQLTHLLFFKSIALLTVSLSLLNCGTNPYEYEMDENVLFGSLSGEPPSLDPAEIGDTLSHQVGGQLHDLPFQYNLTKRPLTLEPALAEALGKEGTHPGIGPNGIIRNDLKGKPTYTIQFKKNISFQKDVCFDPQHQKAVSRKITADDFALSIKRQSDPFTQAQGTFLLSGLIVGFDGYGERVRQKMQLALSTAPNKKVTEISSAPILMKTAMDGVEVLDPHTLRITMTKKSDILKYFFANVFSSPVPAECIAYYNGSSEERPLFSRHPVASGAYKLQEYAQNEKIILVKNEMWRKEYHPVKEYSHRLTPIVDKLYMRIIKQSIATWLLFEQGYIDASGIPTEVFSQVIQNDGLSERFQSKKIELEKSPALVTYYIIFNMNDPVVGGFSQKKKYLRKAISLAIDRDNYIKQYMKSQAIVSEGIIPPGIDGYLDGYKNPLSRFDLKKARSYMKKAGYPGGIDPKTNKPLTIRYLSVANPGALPIVQYYQKLMKEIGIKLQIDSYDWTTLLTKMKKGQFQLSQGGWNADYPEAENFYQLLASKNIGVNGTNSANYSNPTFDKLYESLYATQDPQQKADISAKLMKVFNEDMPWVLMAHRINFALYHHWTKARVEHPLPHGHSRYRVLDLKARQEYAQKQNKPAWLFLIIFFATIFAATFWAVRKRGTIS